MRRSMPRSRIGAYEAEGVAVTLRPSPDPASTAADLLAGKVDAMWGGPLRVLLTHAADSAADTVCFCDVVARDPFFIVGREPRPDFRLADLARPALSPRFPRCRRRGSACRTTYAARGSTPPSLDRISGPSMAENAAALRAGTLDAVQLFQPYVEMLVAEGAGHIWYAAAARGLTAYTTLVARRSVLAARRDEFAAMVRGMYRALRWIAVTSGYRGGRRACGILPRRAAADLCRGDRALSRAGPLCTGPGAATRGVRSAASGDAVGRRAATRHSVRDLRGQHARGTPLPLRGRGQGA